MYNKLYDYKIWQILVDTLYLLISINIISVTMYYIVFSLRGLFPVPFPLNIFHDLVVYSETAIAPTFHAIVVLHYV